LGNWRRPAIAVMSGRRPLVKGCLEAVVNVSGAVMSTACWCGRDGSAGPDDSSAWLFALIIPARSYWRRPLFGLPSLCRWFTSLRRRPRCWSPLAAKTPYRI